MATATILNTATCNNDYMKGLFLENNQYLQQKNSDIMYLGYWTSDDIKGRGYGEFNLQAANIPPDATITKAELIIHVYAVSSSSASVHFYRQSTAFNCNNINLTGWNYLAGGTNSTGILTMQANKDYPVDVLSDVLLYINSKLIYSFLAYQELTSMIKIDVLRLEVTYTLPNPPNAPTNVTANATTSGSTSQVVLDWTHATSGTARTGYRIYNVSSGGSPTHTLPSTATSVTITGLTPSTSYTRYVAAYNGGGESTRVAVTFTTPAPQPTISGASTVHFSGEKYSLLYAPAGSTLTWTITGPFSFSGSSNVTSITNATPLIYKTSPSSSGSGTLTVKDSSGNTLDSKNITAYAAAISGPSTINKGTTNSWELQSGATSYNWLSVYMTAWGPTNGYTVAFTATNSQNNDIVECFVTLNGVTTFFDKFISVV